MLARMLGSQEPDHVRYFTPFAYDEKTIRGILTGAKLDVYLGLFSEKYLVGLAMLRGWDEGYAIPAVGIFVDESYQGRGFASAGLATLIAICRLRSCGKVMAKVYLGNDRAQRFFLDRGFQFHSISADNKVLLFHDLSYGKRR